MFPILSIGSPIFNPIPYANPDSSFVPESPRKFPFGICRKVEYLIAWRFIFIESANRKGRVCFMSKKNILTCCPSLNHSIVIS